MNNDRLKAEHFLKEDRYLLKLQQSGEKLYGLL